MWPQIVVGLFLAAAAYNMFLIPNDIAPGGFTGIGQLVNQLTGWPVGTVALCLNVPLFLLSMRSIGLGFCLRSAAASFALSLLIDFVPFPAVIPMGNSERMLLATVFGGVLGGAGFGLIVRGSATTGGSDMLAALIHRRFPFVTFGLVMLLIDGAVVFASAFVFDVVSALFALISTFIMSGVLDAVVDGINRARAYFVISDQSERIAREVLRELERGVTGLDGQGMFSGARKNVLLVVVNRLESIRLRGIVATIDPSAFVISTNVHEALGEGFAPHIIPK